MTAVCSFRRVFLIFLLTVYDVTAAIYWIIPNKLILVFEMRTIEHWYTQDQNAGFYIFYPIVPHIANSYHHISVVSSETSENFPRFVTVADVIFHRHRSSNAKVDAYTIFIRLLNFFPPSRLEFFVLVKILQTKRLTHRIIVPVKFLFFFI